MGDVVHFKTYDDGTKSYPIPIIEKHVDGETIRCINVDALSPEQQQMYFDGTLDFETGKGLEHPVKS